MKKIKKKFILICSLLAILIIGVIITSRVDIEQQEQPTTTPQIAAPTIARIDLMASAKGAQFIVYDKDNQVLPEADWMSKFNLRGYAILIDGKDSYFVIKANNNTEIKIALRGKWEQGSDKNLIPHWVEYTSLKINGESVLPGNVTVWHDKPYNYTIHAKAGEIYTVEATWQKPTKIPEE